MKNLDSCEFIPFAEEYVSHIIGKTEYIRGFRNMLFRLKRFEKQRNNKLLTNSFTEEIISDFIRFLKTDEPIYYRKHGLKATTINAYLRKLSHLLKRAKYAGYPIQPYAIRRIPEDSPEPVYLSTSELKSIQALKLSKVTSEIRDMFLMGCYTGLRYSDYSRLTEFNFVRSEIIIRTQKTGEKVVIPMHPVVRVIAERYHYCLPALRSKQSFNYSIKRICKKAGINAVFLQEYVAGTELIKK